MDDASLVQIDERYFRLIPSRFPPQALFARIAEGRDDEWAALEAETNPRLKAQERLLGARIEGPPPDRFQNWNHAPFAYNAKYGTRFWPPGIPALELVGDIRTALAVAVIKREHFMGLTEEPTTQMDMRVLCHPVNGRFMDLRDVDPSSPPAERYKLGRPLLERNEIDGLLFRPFERPAGQGIAILSAETLGRAVQGAHFRFVWDGSRVQEIYSFDTGEQFSPEGIDNPDLKIVR